MRLSGKNFQPWADFEIEIEGLTVLTGLSDTGKSALFRALKGVLRNELPAEWVRDNQDDPMEIRVEIAGHSIAVRRPRKGSTKYVIDGDDFAKLAGAVPDQLKNLKFGEVVIGDFDVDPIFGRQNSPQFLIDPEAFKPSEVNAILGAFGGTEKLESGKKEANLRKTQKDAEARTIAVQMRDAEERKAALAEMQTQGEAVNAALYDSEVSIRKLEAETHWLIEAFICCQRLIPLRKIQDKLVLPDISGLEQLHKQALYAERAAEAAAYAKWLAKPTATLASVAIDWAAARRLWNEIAALEGAVEAGKHVVSTDKLKTSLSGVENVYSEAVGLWSSIKRLEVLAALLGELKGSADKLAGVEAELSAAQAEARKGLCPKCGKPTEHYCE